ncbi:peptidase C39-like protein [Mucilaginibacter oryzae]|uniref:Peptidase C39-like protein n=1 Tax=Mucilaginibacter oryzae TaxID=468058 RepID=A0A316HII8_9SPHI|nr:vitamin K epoxide reductase family protein [Mucilaginibacter oryzae]PWK80336.1 peptidase C39-like protein [Mucilaginibacter oryzae]
MFSLLSNILEPKANGPEAAFLLTELLKVNISESTLKKEIEEHPDYPSLLSISDVLNSHGIENLGIDFIPGKLGDIPCPFITQIKGVESDFDFFTVVKEVTDQTVTYFEPVKRRWTTSSREFFLKYCSCVALLAEAADHAGEREYATKIRQQKRKSLFESFAVLFLPLMTLLAGGCAFLQYKSLIFLPFTFMVLTLCGCIIGALLIWYELDQHNPILQQICTYGRKVNCGAILQSKGSKLAGISWSAIGFSYFTGILLLLLFNGLANSGIIHLISWISSIASFYIVFSIYYQWRVAKQWCVLCLCVQAILALQTTIIFTSGWPLLMSLNTITPELIIQTIVAFMIPFLATLFLVSCLEKMKESKYIKTELQKLKHDPLIFQALLSKQKKITESTEGLGIIIGNPKGTQKILKVCNPYCGPCARAHVPMHALIQNNSDVQIQIVFPVSKEKNDARTPIVRHFLSIAETGDHELLADALDDWYLSDNKNYEAFAEKYPVPNSETGYDDQMLRMANWCDKMNIKVTPTFFVNNHKLSNIYTVNDLKYFLLQ